MAKSQLTKIMDNLAKETPSAAKATVKTSGPKPPRIPTPAPAKNVWEHIEKRM